MTAPDSRPRVAVVGAGPAGLMATREACLRGCAVTLIDEAPRPGGQIYRQPAPGLGAVPIGASGEFARKRKVLDAFAEVAETIDYRPGTTAYAVFAGPELHLARDDASEAISADALVLATGVSERAVPFPGWTLPGVFYAGGLQALMKAQGLRAGDRVAVAGAGPLPVAVAAQLVEAGAEVACVALLTPLNRMARKPLALWAGREVLREGFGYLRGLRAAGVPLLDGWAPLSAKGQDRVERLTVARHDGSGRPIADSARAFEVDTVAMNFGFTANSELACMAGAEVRFDLALGGWVPVADEFGRTSAPGVFVAGDGAGLRGALVAAAEGRIAGAAAAAQALGGRVEEAAGALADAFAERSRHERFQEAVRLTLQLPGGVWDWAGADTTICRCEGVTRGRLERALADSHASVDAVKRNTRAGMGWCGGRTCLATVAAIAARQRPDWTPRPTTPRPLARPVPLGALARRTS
jgi:NADPH-dependent 2,4-dienoyl-CoA reductase/sulfur reductase-like enzyme